jgi:hypothetical protein
MITSLFKSCLKSQIDALPNFGNIAHLLCIKTDRIRYVIVNQNLYHEFNYLSPVADAAVGGPATTTPSRNFFLAAETRKKRL